MNQVEESLEKFRSLINKNEGITKLQDWDEVKQIGNLIIKKRNLGNSSKSDFGEDILYKWEEIIKKLIGILKFDSWTKRNIKLMSATFHWLDKQLCYLKNTFLSFTESSSSSTNRNSSFSELNDIMNSLNLIIWEYYGKENKNSKRKNDINLYKNLRNNLYHNEINIKFKKNENNSENKKKYGIKINNIYNTIENLYKNFSNGVYNDQFKEFKKIVDEIKNNEKNIIGDVKLLFDFLYPIKVKELGLCGLCKNNIGKDLNTGIGIKYFLQYNNRIYTFKLGICWKFIIVFFNKANKIIIDSLNYNIKNNK